MLSLGKGLAEAEEVYYLANGSYTVDINSLDLDIPATCSSLGASTDEINPAAQAHWACGKDFVIELNENGFISVNYCPNDSAVWDTCHENRLAQMSFRLQQFALTGYTGQAGKLLCNVYNNSAIGKAICGGEGPGRQPF